MPTLQRFVEKDAITGPTQAVAQLDILNRRAGEAPLVEATHAIEGRSHDGTAARPEGSRLSVACLVHEMMQEVPISGHQSRRRREGVVGAEHGGDFSVAIKKCLYPPNRVVGYDNVGVDEEQNLSSRVSGPVIARGGGPDVPGEAQEPGAEVSSSGGDIIGRGIIDDDELRVGTGCGSQGQEALRELVRVVVQGTITDTRIATSPQTGLVGDA